MKFRRTVPRARPLNALQRAAIVLALAAASGAHGASAAPLTPAPAASTAGAASSTAAAQQDAHELVELGVRHEHGEGVERNPARAHELYCTAARAGSTDGLLRLGWMYANGRGMPRDDALASSLFRRAAAAGSDLGARLAAAIRSDEDRLPNCLTASAPAAAAAADPGPTPTVDAPAEFRAARSGPEQQRLVATVIRMAREHRLDPRLVFALIRVESGFDPQARSVKNAQGLMQLIPETAERFAVRNTWDPVENLRGGMGYLRWLLSYFKGDVVLTLAAYNAGEGAVDRFRGVPPYPETLAYVQRIRAFYPFDRHAFDPMVARLNPPRGPAQSTPGPRTEAARDATPKASVSVGDKRPQAISTGTSVRTEASG